MNTHTLFISLFLYGLCSTIPSFAQRGDKKNETQAEVWRTMEVPAAPVLSPEEALKSFHLAPGFRIELVACEPMIKNPVAIRFDEFNRLWVVEMTEYMPKVDGSGEDQKTGRISVLEDTNHDGRMDKSTVFLDELEMPRAIALVKGGVLVAEPPTLWFAQDLDGDLVSDKKTAVSKYARQGPVEHTENGLRPALDNWMYNAKSGRRFKWIDQAIVEEKTSTRGQWGIAQDNYGRLYYNSNSSYLHADSIPYHYLVRNPALKKPKFGGSKRVVGTSEIFSARVNPGINRGYQSHMLQADGRLARVTAISGQTIYRGDHFPADYVSDAFIPEPAANAVAHFSIRDEEGNLNAEHHAYPHPTWEKVEFLTSTDERFRPVNTENGPDGALYIVDLYHGILQHKVYVTSFLRKQILERELDKNNLNGRIYRVVRDKAPINRQPNQLAKASTADLVNTLQHPNGWMRDTAQRLLIAAGDAAAVPALNKLAHGPNHLAQIHALWTLEGLGKVSAEALKGPLLSAHPQVRIAALRTGEKILAAHQEQVDSLIQRESHPAVLTQLMLSLGEVPDLPRMKTLLHRQPTLAEAALSGLKDLEAAFHALCDADPEWDNPKFDKQLASLTQKDKSKDKSTLPPLSSEDLALFKAGANDYLINCSACHLPNGEGQPAIAPTLVNTSWVNGSPDRLARIVLNGLMGPIKIDGDEWDLVMPPHRDHPLLDDKKIAGVLTYVRRSWGNNAPPIQPHTITKIRQATSDRIPPWTVDELMKVK